MLFLTYNALAQYTNVINSNRPGLSESPYSVGTGVYQLETSIFYRETNKHPTFYRPQSYGVDFLLRSSFLNEKLEFNVNLAYQNQEIGFQNIFNSSYLIIVPGQGSKIPQQGDKNENNDLDARRHHRFYCTGSQYFSQYRRRLF